MLDERWRDPTHHPVPRARVRGVATMTRVKQAELRAVTAALEYGEFETPEEAAEACIRALDDVRAGDLRFYYLVVVEFPFGHKDSGQSWYSAVGPYPGARSARNALQKFMETVGNLAKFGIVVPVRTPLGFEDHLKKVG